jgi:hypothetical protein
VRQHMFLTVTVGGVTYVIDPGFGPFACPFPIPRDGTPIPGRVPAHRLAREGNDWVLISPGFPQATAPWITGALVQTPDIVAVEALPSHLHPCTKRADGWELFDHEANGLCCGAKAMITELGRAPPLRFGTNSSADAA